MGEEEGGREAEVASAQADTLAWPDHTPAASYDSISKMLTLGARSEELARYIEDVFALKNCGHDAQEAVLRDYYTDVVWFAVDVKLTNQQTSALLHVMVRLLANLSEGELSSTQNAQSFGEMLEGHSSNQSDTDSDGNCFDFPRSCKNQVVQFVASGLFKHYGMYEFAFHGERSINRMVLDFPIGLPQAPAPLDEAVSTADWLVNNPPPVNADAETAAADDSDSSPTKRETT